MNNDTNKLRQSLSANSGQLNDDGLFAKCVSAAATANQGATTANDAIQRIAYMAPVTKQAPVHAVILHDNQKVKIKVVCVGKNAYIQTNPSTRDAGVAIRDREILGPEKAQYLLPKIDEYAHMHKLDSINIPGPVYITGIMPRIREYAYRISMETVSIKIALDQIDHIAISTTGANIGDIADKGDIANKGDAMDINDVARLIIETFTITFEEEELTQYVTKLLQACNPTIDKTYTPKLIEFVRSSVNVPSDRPACVHAISNGNASDSLKSILESASTLINEIDTNYFNMDDVFLKEDMFAFLSDQAYAAARAAHKADHNVQKAWKSIGRPNAICPLEQLQQIYDATIEARNSAQKANDAHLNFAKYFDEFRPTIRLIIKYHNVLRNQTIGPIRRSRYKAASKYFDRLQEHLNRLQNCLNILEAYLNVLNTAIITSYTTANLYKSSYNQYKNLADSIQQPKQ